MHEILRELPAGARVLDLGCAAGSFDTGEKEFLVVRIDRGRTNNPPSDFVQADAAALPFPAGSFDAVISNHSLEHFEQLSECLNEIRRVVKAAGYLYVAVPDASTFSDWLYRSLARGGGHVNAFTSAGDVAQQIAHSTALAHTATRTLCTSLSWLNRKDKRAMGPRRLMLMGGGTEISLHLFNLVFRLADRFLHTRLAVYGWAFYFGNVKEEIDLQTWTSVCIRCGAGQSSACLLENDLVRRRMLFRTYRCPGCGTTNLFFNDNHYHY